MNARYGAVLHRPWPGQPAATRPCPQITLGRLIYIYEGPYHSVARWCVHYCKSDYPHKGEIVIFGPPGLRNDSTILHNWLPRWT